MVQYQWEDIAYRRSTYIEACNLQVLRRKRHGKRCFKEEGKKTFVRNV